jgi:hypothetical protein
LDKIHKIRRHRLRRQLRQRLALRVRRQMRRRPTRPDKFRNSLELFQPRREWRLLRREWRLLRRESRRALRPVLRPPRDQRLARR